MNKIIELALKSANITAEQISAIITMAEATPNKEVAILLFLGLYERPEVSVSIKNKEGMLFNLIHYDIFTNNVEIKSEPYIKYKYYEKFNPETNEYSGDWQWSKSAKYQHAKVYNEKEYSERTISLEEWEAGKFSL